MIALHASFLLLNMPAQFLQEQLLISLCCILVGHIQTAALEEQCSFTDDTIINSIMNSEEEFYDAETGGIGGSY